MIPLLFDTLSCLNSLYTSTNGQQWKNNEGWNQPDICQRFGVECENGTPLYLDLTRNNLQGTVPNCFQDMNFLEIYLSHNNVHGPMPLINPSLETLHLRNTNLTSLPDNICDAKISSLRASLSRVSGAFKPCYFAISDLDLAMLGLISQEQTNVYVLSEALKISHNDLSTFTLFFTQPVKILDLTATNARGIVDLANHPNLSQLNIIKTKIKLTGKIPAKLQVFDISDTQNALPPFSHFPSTIKVISARNTIQNRFTPTFAEIDAFSSDLSLDLTNCSFFCGLEQNALFDCVGRKAQIETVQFGKVKFSVDFTVEDLVNYSFIGKFQGGEEELTNCKIDEFITCDIAGVHDFTDIVIIFGGVTISDHADNLQAEIDKQFELVDDSGVDEISPFVISRQVVKLEHNFTVTGMANCPGYTEFVQTILTPISLEFPDVLTKFEYVFLPLSVPVDDYLFKTYAMHGQFEAYGDSILTCARNLMQNSEFVRLSVCYSVEQNFQKCLGEYAADILICANDNPYVEGDSRYAYDVLNSGPSPTVFVDDMEVPYESYLDVVKAMCQIMPEADSCKN